MADLTGRCTWCAHPEARHTDQGCRPGPLDPPCRCARHLYYPPRTGEEEP